MILYTPLALEEVLTDLDETTSERMYLAHNGKYFCVDKTQTGHQLIGITSTDPNDYLNENYLPGIYL